jgi:hypothetical protein
VSEMRPTEHPTAILKRSYNAAAHSGLFEKIEAVCRAHGEPSVLTEHPQRYLYRLNAGKHCLYFDSGHNQITAYEGSQLMCSTTPGNKIFVYGAWVGTVEALYAGIWLEQQQKSIMRQKIFNLT